VTEAFLKGRVCYQQVLPRDKACLCTRTVKAKSVLLSYEQYVAPSDANLRVVSGARPTLPGSNCAIVYREEWWILLRVRNAQYKSAEVNV
jgi:hypothetical protein